MFISDLAGMVVKPVVKGVATITSTTSEAAFNSEVGQLIIGGTIILGGLLYIAYNESPKKEE